MLAEIYHAKIRLTSLMASRIVLGDVPVAIKAKRTASLNIATKKLTLERESWSVNWMAHPAQWHGRSTAFGRFAFCTIMPLSAFDGSLK